MVTIHPVSFKGNSSNNTINSPSVYISPGASRQIAFGSEKSADTQPQTPQNSSENGKTSKLPYIISGIALAATIAMGFMMRTKSKTIKILTEQMTKMQEAINNLSSATTKGMAEQTEALKKLAESLNKQPIGKEGQRDFIIGACPALAGLGAAGFYFAGDETKESTEAFHGVNLRKANPDPANKLMHGKALEFIQTLANSKVNKKSNLALGPGSTIWALTCELGKIKEGGLAVVPDNVRTNLKQMKVNMPTFIPMYINDKGTFEEKDGKYTYTYGKDNKYELTEVASVQVQAFRKGKVENETVTLYSHAPEKETDKDTSKIYFLKNDNYFKSEKGIYKGNEKAGEEEKFAFFSRAMYDLIKLKIAPGSTDGKILNKEEFEKLKTPQGLMVNDWQPAATIAITKYVSELEKANGEISKEACDQIQNLASLLVIHNCAYQGQVDYDSASRKKYNESVEGVMSNILNTAYGKYAKDITENATVNINNNNDLKYVNLLGLESGKKALNLSNMGYATADRICPVSPNYTEEIVGNEDKSKWLWDILKQRKNMDTVKGVLNGHDRKLLDLRKSGEIFPHIFKQNNNTKHRPYTHEISRDEFREIQQYNKKIFLTETLPFHLANPGDAEIIEDGERTTSSTLPKDIDPLNTPVYTFIGRGSSQKGLDIMKETILKTLGNWEKDHPDKPPKPLFVISALKAQEDEEVAMKNILTDTKKHLSKEDYDRVLIFYGNWDGYTAARAFSDFALIPSHFEPCGLVQSEFQALGVIPVTTCTGGFINTIYDPKLVKEEDKAKFHLEEHIGQTGYISDGHHAYVNDTVNDYTALIKRTADDYFNDKKKIQDIAYNALQLDHSWVRPDGKGGLKGSIFEYLRQFGYNDEGIGEVQENFLKAA